MLPVFEDDLFNQTSSAIVAKTIDQLGQHYKVQANPREINLFYLKDSTRARIEQDGQEWKVTGTSITFYKRGFARGTADHPERFSPNVILRGIFQETVLPNILFVGGGGELAYWLELKGIFEHHGVPYPVLVLRNSFLVSRKKMESKKLNASDFSWPIFSNRNRNC